uniref:C-like opsin n=1 Tax=Tripedalia cystophora TaxID=6141 RepID=A0A059NTG3_TRICY|nr:c-like opsin [Tripedalia cystophora]
MMSNNSSLEIKLQVGVKSSETAYNIVAGIMIFITTFGAISNGVVIYAFLKIFKGCPSTFNGLIISVTVSDILMIVISGTINIASGFNRGFVFGEAGCSFLAFWVHFFSVSSVAHLTALSIERYRIISERSVHHNFSRTRTAVVILICYLYSFAWVIPPIVGWSSYTTEGMEISCSVNWKAGDWNSMSYNITILFTVFIIPFGIILICYRKLFRLLKNARDVDVGSPDLAKRRSVEKSVASLVVIMVVAFLISWSPYVIMSIWAMLPFTEEVSPLAATLPALIAKSSTIYNPIIYGMKHRAFRQQISGAWRKRFRNRMGVQEPSPEEVEQ